MRTSSIARAAKAAWIPLIAALAPWPVAAQTVTWRVVVGEGSTVVTPDLPTGNSRLLTDIHMGDAGRDLFAARVSSPTAQQGYYAQKGDRFVRYVQQGVTTATGPGRSGAESNHVFLDLNNGWGGAAPDGQRAVLGRAGDPTATLNASYGIWRWDGVRNIEVVRGGTDGPLGPNLGANWVYRNSSALGSARMRSGGDMIIYGEVQSPGAGYTWSLGMHEAGQGNRICMRSSDTDPARAPGLAAGDSFSNSEAGLGRFAFSRTGRVYGRMAASGSREGIWEFCDGAPRAVVATGFTNNLGPSLGDATATFTGVYGRSPLPASRERLVYFADWRIPPATSRAGLFVHDNGTNLPVAYTEPTGFYGPNWNNATWNSFALETLSVAHDYAVFTAAINTADATPRGLFRVRIGERPQLVGLLNLTNPDYRPEEGRTWQGFDAMAVLSNGDILLDARTNPNSTHDLWLLRNGQPPRRLLSTGTPITINTTQGAVQTTISSFSVPSDGVRNADGSDSWVGVDGTIYISANAANYGRVLITTKLDVPNLDIIFAGGFE